MLAHPSILTEPALLDRAVAVNQRDGSHEAMPRP
jgi:hypothetical protein